jgi:cytochrome c oxidase subunit IV
VRFRPSRDGQAIEETIMEDHETVTSDDSSHSQQEEQRHKRRMYLRFAAMIATSTTVMFLLTYTNAFEWDHIRWSEERLYMAILMGSAMALIMLGFMWGMMYKDVRLNVGIMIVAMAVGTTALWLSRSQSFVDDREYMKGMIPHHSIAILTSERSDLDDVRVCDLAVEITEAQRREISEMDWLIDDIEENGPATTKEAAEERQVPDFAGSADRTCP